MNWPDRIREAWQSSVTAIIETGRLLVEAKDGPEKLEHGQFLAMIETELPFGARTAQMLMSIATDPKLANTKHASLLPPAWTTLYELTQVPDDVFEARIADGTIKPDMQREDAARLHKPFSEPRHTAYEVTPAARRAFSTGRPMPSALWRGLVEVLVARRNALGMSQNDLERECGWADGQASKFEGSDNYDDRRMPNGPKFCEWICGLRLHLTVQAVEMQPATVQPADYRARANVR